MTSPYLIYERLSWRLDGLEARMLESELQLSAARKTMVEAAGVIEDLVREVIRLREISNG